MELAEYGLVETAVFRRMDRVFLDSYKAYSTSTLSLPQILKIKGSKDIQISKNLLPRRKA